MEDSRAGSDTSTHAEVYVLKTLHEERPSSGCFVPKIIVGHLSPAQGGRGEGSLQWLAHLVRNLPGLHDSTRHDLRSCLL